MILLTGGSGFVGRAILASLITRTTVRLALRGRVTDGFPENVEIVTASLAADQNWGNALAGVDAVVHCAARVHVVDDSAADPLAEFRRVNVAGTLNLARQAAAAGVRRFLFISSIGVNGGITFDQPFAADSEVFPHTPYAVSKYEAEVGLRELAAASKMEIVIIRPPLVYGPNAPGNFSTLMRCLNSGFPLPLGAIIANRRSFVFLDNLVDLVVTCLDHSAAANQTFLVSDGESLSTVALLQRLGAALGRPVRLISVPIFLLEMGAALLSKPELAQRLCGSLEVDISKTRGLLDWGPPISADEGFRRTAAYWAKSNEASCG